ncbi:MsnO8 family LLM class oxidoreductase [Kosakonia sacchari]|uniref:MsnO8 family LLM class oxidoreductase n=1 Tax=Kosakonia sacchari TaxID=1158459 RepID=UPI0013622857|nr:MsnO8 family LLM class oxidoreductase [Kosakonia sacchari]QHM94900.1 MsnO8 family LLM class oxidoreductase [Kosakonia sacchari]
MSYRLSLLDKSPIAEHETAQDALARTLQLAQQAENWGYHRFWIAEHHNTTQLASPSPELVIAWILGQTRRIRVGSGGVMLQHYSPFKVAENFNLLATLAPGRVDLGVGKAPGGLPLSTRALQQGINSAEKGSFADQLAQLDNWLSLAKDDQAEETVLATPLPPQRADSFLLGASLESAALAAKLDWNFVFAAHLNGDKALLRDVVTQWQQQSQRDTLVAVQVIVAETEAQANALAQQVEVWGVELANGQRVSVDSEAQGQAFARQAGSPAVRIAKREPSLIAGTPQQVLAGLDHLHQQFAIDEFIIDTPISEGSARLTSVLRLAQAHANTKATQEVAG